MAAEVLFTISQDEVERTRLRSEEKNHLDIQSDMAYERQEGTERNALNNARNALAEGLSLEQVHRITRLDIQTLQSQ